MTESNEEITGAVLNEDTVFYLEETQLDLNFAIWLIHDMGDPTCV